MARTEGPATDVSAQWPSLTAIVPTRDRPVLLRRALRATDRVVYGNLLSEDAREVDAAFQRLRTFAERQFDRVGTS